MKDGNEDENENKNEDEDKDEIIKILMSSYEDYNDDEINNRIKKIKWSFRSNNWQIKIIWRPNKMDKKSRKSRWLLSCQRFWW